MKQLLLVIPKVDLVRFLNVAFATGNGRNVSWVESKFLGGKIGSNPFPLLSEVYSFELVLSVTCFECAVKLALTLALVRGWVPTLFGLNGP